MPVVAVGAAMYAGGTIAAAGGLAAFAATAGTWAAIGAVGTIAMGVGVVTGNKNLTRIGAIAGLAGGVGALAENQGWFTSSELASTGASEVAQAGTASTVAESGSIGASLGEASAGVASPAADLATAGTTGASSTGGLMTQAAAEPLTPLVAKDVGSFGGVAQVTAGAPVAGAGGVLDTIKSLGGFMEQNKMLSAIGANFVGGLLDDKKEAETELLRTRADAERAQSNMQQQQAANANAVPDITNLRVNPAADVYAGMQSKTYKPVRVGLINS